MYHFPGPAPLDLTRDTSRPKLLPFAKRPPIRTTYLCSVQYSSPVIEIRDVSKSYGRFRALDRCTTSVARGSVVVVCGPSGSGKSTLIRCVNGLETVDDGSITVDGVDVTAPNTDLAKLRSRIGMVFQSFELFPHKTVLENLNLAQVEVLRRSRDVATARSTALLERVGLADQAAKYPSGLSGGQQQRVAIARALAMDPVAMLFDEPTSALDPEMITEVLDVMVGLADEGMTMMVVTHEMAFARRVADRVLFMDAGRIVEDRDAGAFFTEPHTERAREFLSKILHHTGDAVA
jgi:glutamate/aspartate transport system ATP-binding protein